MLRPSSIASVGRWQRLQMGIGLYSFSEDARVRAIARHFGQHGCFLPERSGSKIMWLIGSRQFSQYISTFRPDTSLQESYPDQRDSETACQPGEPPQALTPKGRDRDRDRDYDRDRNHGSDPDRNPDGDRGPDRYPDRDRGYDRDRDYDRDHLER